MILDMYGRGAEAEAAVPPRPSLLGHCSALTPTCFGRTFSIGSHGSTDSCWNGEMTVSSERRQKEDDVPVGLSYADNDRIAIYLSDASNDIPLQPQLRIEEVGIFTSTKRR